MKPYTHVEFMNDLSSDGYETACSSLRESYQYLVIKIITSLLMTEGFTTDMPSHVEELNQIIWLEIFKSVRSNINKENFKPYTALPSYISTITRNHCKKYFIRIKQNRYTIVDDVCYGTKSYTFQSDLENKILCREVESVISKLPEKEQQVIRLYKEGLSIQQIADKVGKTPQNIRVMIFRIKQELRKKLNNNR